MDTPHKQAPKNKKLEALATFATGVYILAPVAVVLLGVYALASLVF